MERTMKNGGRRTRTRTARGGLERTEARRPGGRPTGWGGDRPRPARPPWNPPWARPPPGTPPPQRPAPACLSPQRLPCERWRPPLPCTMRAAVFPGAHTARAGPLEEECPVAAGKRLRQVASGHNRLCIPNCFLARLLPRKCSLLGNWNSCEQPHPSTPTCQKSAVLITGVVAITRAISHPCFPGCEIPVILSPGPFSADVFNGIAVWE